MIVIGLVVVGAALVPAISANSGETATVRGDVTLSGRPLAFFPVGFWNTGSGVVRSTTTDANGRFTLDVPVTLDGYAYAGTAPDARRAIVEQGGQQVVRGVIGVQAVPDGPSATYQNLGTATARSLAANASQLHFRLHEPGRISGTSPVSPKELSAVQVRRADNSVVQTLRLDARGRFRSMPLVPAQYGVVLIPRSPALPTVASAVVRGGATTAVLLGKPEAGATIAGTVRTVAGAVGGGVPVLLEQDDKVLAATSTSSTGDWSFAGVAAGEFTVEVGRFDEPASPAASASAVLVPIPGATATPTPTVPTATPAPSPSSGSPQTVAVEPVPRTADAVLPETFPVVVPEGLGVIGIATDVQPAGRITGTVSRPDPTPGTESAAVRVVVEEAATGRIVRGAAASADGRYAVGGLQPGAPYRVFAVTDPDDRTLAEMGEASAIAAVGGAVADIAISEPALTLSGTVSGAGSGQVTAGDPALLERTAGIDESGAYALQGLVPGAYPVVVDSVDAAPSVDRLPAQPVGVQVSADTPVVDLQQGPEPAVFRGWFIASGAGVPAVSGSAVDEVGDVVQFGPRTRRGHVEVDGLYPGTYEYDAASFRGTAPAVDGPWYYLPPTGTFSLSGRATTDVGPIVLHIRIR